MGLGSGSWLGLGFADLGDGLGEVEQVVASLQEGVEPRKERVDLGLGVGLRVKG